MNTFANDVECVTYDIDGLCQWFVPKGFFGTFKDSIGMGWIQGNRESWLRETPGRKVVVQAGGNVGLYPRLFSVLFEQVYTFEPEPLNFHCLVQNCQVPNVTKINGALGADHRMIHNTGSGGGNTVQGGGSVPQFMIDDLVLSACDLIQLDVEGYEAEVLRGAQETIKKHRPTVSLERGKDEHLRLLQELGSYRVVGKTFEDVIYRATP